MSDHLALDLLATPVWIVSLGDDAVVYRNRAAELLSAGLELDDLRNGSHSAHAEEQLAACLPALRAREQLVEIWTIRRKGQGAPLSCHLSLLRQGAGKEQILVEGILASLPGAPSAASLEQGENSLYEKLFRSSSAPMILIDPAADGRIVDANLAACRFYGYDHAAFCGKHTWEINSLGRDVLPIMNEVAKLSGGHRPLNFVHRMADGSLRDVQTYAGPLELNGKRLMLSIIHDVTEQKRLKNELQLAASRDHLTGLWNRRHFIGLLDKARLQKRRNDLDYCLLLLDVDHFKHINDQFGHEKGDEALILLARTLEARTRETDSVCRWGGEEFTVLLPQTELANAVHLAECLRAAVEHLRVPHLPRLTISLGVAQHTAEETTESLLRRADAALYQAKSAGRNRVVAA